MIEAPSQPPVTNGPTQSAGPRVCLVTPPLDARGGQAVQAAALVRHLQAEGWTVRHVAPDAELPRRLAWAAGVRGLRTLLRQLAFLPRLAEAIRSTDVVHVFTASYVSFWLSAVPVLLLARRSGRPVLLHYHSGEAEDHLRRWWYGAAPILRRADQLVTPSAYLADLFASYGLNATVIPNIVDVARFARAPGARCPVPGGDAASQLATTEPGTGHRAPGTAFPRLLCTRNFEPLYNVGGVLRAFSSVREALPGATLTLVGSGSEETRLRALAADLGFEAERTDRPAGPLPAVTFAGSVAPTEMPAYYAAADLFVNASNIDNMPVSILEAFAAGVPVVTTDAGGIPWLVRDGLTGLLVPRNDPTALAAAVLRLSYDPDLARELARRARAEVARYTWEAAGPAWRALYRTLWTSSRSLSLATCSPSLVRRSPHEIFHRSRQAIRMRMDAMVAALPCPVPGARCPARAGADGLARRLAGAPVGPGTGHRAPGAAFWFHPGERGERAALLAERLPETRTRILEAADAALAGRVLLFGHLVAALPNARRPTPGDDFWHRDPATGRAWPRVFWTAIDPLPGNPIGDVKLVWELNRHAHFLSLAQAAVFTGDEEYGRTLADQMASWMAQNPYGIGVHWSSSLEVALRALTWLWALHLAGDWPGLPGEARRTGARLLCQSARHISRYLSLYTSPNTHLLGEALALWTIGAACPELPGAERFRREGRAHLIPALLRQIHPDGGPIEQSASYHRYVLEMGLLALTLGEYVGEPWPAAVWERLEAAAAYAMHLTGPDGLLPHLGDCDGGRTLPFSDRDPHDARGWLAVAAVLFGRPDMKQAAGAPSEELIWLLGAEGLARWDALDCGVALRTPRSSAFPDTGTVVMKAARHCLVFDAGPHGFGRAAHGHADALAIDLSIHGERVLVDPGTYQYGDCGLRNPFRSAAAHNTVIVDEVEPATPAGAFAWARRVEGRLTGWGLDAQFEWAEGSHEGYRALGDPVSVRRKLLFCKPAYWVLQDSIDGRQEHTFDLLFHLAPGASVNLLPSGEVHVRTAGACSLWLVTRYQEGMDVDVTTGQLAPPHGWVSPRYGERLPAPVVRFRCRARAPAALCTLLYPDAEKKTPDASRQTPAKAENPSPTGDWRLATGVSESASRVPPKVQWLPARRAGGRPTVGSLSADGRGVVAATAGGAIVSTPDFRDLLLFRHDDGGPIEVAGWETDAEMAVIREAPGSEATTWQIGGSYVRKAALGSRLSAPTKARTSRLARRHAPALAES